MLLGRNLTGILAQRGLPLRTKPETERPNPLESNLLQA